MPSVEFNDKDETNLTLSPIESFWVRKAIREYAKSARTTTAVTLYDILEEMEKD